MQRRRKATSLAAFDRGDYRHCQERPDRQEMTWMRSWLLTLQRAGKIDVEEEFHQACLHITVYKSYARLIQWARLCKRRRAAEDGTKYIWAA